jgi:NAD(P)H dehydrogenase (quinone)
MHAFGTHKAKYPIITPDEFKAVDVVIIDAPARYILLSPIIARKRPDRRYGRVPAQVSTFFDQCGGLWATGAMIGEFVRQRS